MIVDFSGPQDAALAGQDEGAVTSMVANLVRTVRPLEARDTPPQETGRILVVDDKPATATCCSAA